MEISNLVLTSAGLNAFDSGAWVGSIPDGGDIRLKVLPLAHPEVQKSINAKLEALRATSVGGAPLTAEQIGSVVNAAVGETALLDWEGLTANGQPLPFDRAKAIEWTTTREGMKFADLAFRAAKMLSDNANAYVEVVEKNSSAA